MNTTDDAAVKLLLTRAKEGNKGAMDQLASLCQLTHDGFGRRLLLRNSNRLFRMLRNIPFLKSGNNAILEDRHGHRI